MRRTFVMAAVIAALAPGVWAKHDPIWSLPELSEGWSPAQAAEYQGAQIEYAQMKERFGEQSAEAARARQRMIELSRALRADQREEVPRSFHPGTNGTLAPPEAFEQKIDPIQ